MRERSHDSDHTPLLAFIAEALSKHLERDAGLAAACAGLRRSGHALVLEVVAVPGDGRPRVVVKSEMPPVTQWTSEDRELLRSLGIAGDADQPPEPTPKPGWRQPR